MAAASAARQFNFPVSPDLPHGKDNHFVQFWENDDFLAESVSQFIGTGLRLSEGGIVIATAVHLKDFANALSASGVDTEGARRSGQLILLDAEQTLSSFMVDGKPDARKFDQEVGSLVRMMRARYPKVRAYGEMVGLLWQDGDIEGTIRLETLWNELGSTEKFSLLCGYSLSAFKDAAHSRSFSQICQTHSHVFPTEDFLQLAQSDDQLRAIALLEQRAKSLEIELERRRKAEEDLRSSERELSDFFDNAVMGLHIVAADGTILRANRAELELLGYSESEYIGHSITEFHADADVIQDIIGRLSRNESLINQPARLRCKDGSIKHVLIDSNALFENGKFIHTRCFTRDVTKQVRADEELKRALKTRDEFMSIASHELKTPLTSLQLQTQVRKRAVSKGDYSRFSPERLPKLLSDDERQIQRLTRLVDDMLDITRLQTGKLSLDLVEFDLRSLATDTLARFSADLETAGCEAAIEAPGPVTGRWDHYRIEQVLTNLITNAIKYGAGSPILVRISQEGSIAKLAVIDRGIGISTDDQKRIFGQFERAVSPSMASGLGLGLFIARQIIEQHGGRIAVESDPGLGSTFTVELPITR